MSASRLTGAVLATLLVATLCTTAHPATLYAAEQLQNNNHSHYDTDDYCLKAHDVQLGLIEVNKSSVEDLKASVLNAAYPLAQLRVDGYLVNEYATISSADFSQVNWQVPGTYEVTLTYAAHQLSKPSIIIFSVYVVDDLAKDPVPVNPDPVDPDPIEPTPIEPTPTDPTPVEPTPTDPAPADPAPAETAPTDPAPAESEPADSTPAEPDPAPNTTPQTVAPITPSNTEPTNNLPSNNTNSPIAESSVTAQPPEESTPAEESGPSLATSEQTTSLAAHAPTVSPEPANTGWEGVVATIEIALITTLCVAASLLGGFIVSDIRTLHWYNNKKREFISRKAVV